MYYTSGVCVVCGQSAGMHTWYCARGRALRGREARCARAERQSRRVLCAAQEYVDIIYELRLRRVWTECRAAYVVLRPRGALRGPPDSDCASAQGYSITRTHSVSNKVTRLQSDTLRTGAEMRPGARGAAGVARGAGGNAREG